MRNSRFYLLATLSLMIAAALLFQACNKDDDNNNEPDAPTYTDGSGEIGEQGGTVMIDDDESPLNGASVVIPEGALSEEQEIKIQVAPKDVSYPHDTSATIVELSPSGQEFNQPVELHLPFNENADTSRLSVYYYDKENSRLKELPGIINFSKKTIKTKIKHFSWFLISDNGTKAEVEYYFDESEGKLYTNLKLAGFSEENNNLGLEGIPANNNQFNNAEWIVNEYYQNGGWQEITAFFRVKLKKKRSYWFNSTIVAKELWVRLPLDGQSLTTGIEVFDPLVSTITPLYSVGVSTSEQRENYSSGKALCFTFENDEINASDKYYIEAEWGLIQMSENGDILDKFTQIYEVNNIDHAQETPNMSNENIIDQNENGVLDNYDGYNSNNPPSASFTVSPEDGTTNTTFEFDASGSNDNEDPISQLEVRWDFDGNGSWDTNWETDKTVSHQYNSEGVYTAKLKVRDTEGLTDQYTRSITVDNGGGGTTGTFTDPRDGQTYETVEIGNQVWFAENLNYETDNSWWYDNDPDNGDTYGRLYTWEAALDACPDGWHLPSDEEWKTLEMELSMSQSEADDTGWRGTDQGEQMKSTSGWNNNGNGTNSSGFSALPGGGRYSYGSFYGLGGSGYWWAATEYSGSHAWSRSLGCDGDQVVRGGRYKANGGSVRCLKE